MKEALKIPPHWDGALWFSQYTGRPYHMHKHEELEVNLVVRGTAAYLVDERRFVLKTGAQIWLFPEQEHLLIDQSPDFAMWILVLRANVLKRACTTDASKPLLALKPAGSFCRTLTKQAAQRLGALFETVLDSREDTDRYNTALPYAMLEAWNAFRSDQTDDPRDMLGEDIHPAVEKAARLIHYETEVKSVEALGKEAGLSAGRLSRLFKKQLGISLVEYRNKQRLERFLSLYGTGRRKTMMTAALEAGFGSYPQFHRIFKQLMGYSPAEYRRRSAEMPPP
ncbi:MAG TPA: helix-turn-helix transcriptional regulator, partial [Planctomycetota bacterium]|nr:helix-turn-helix transcriptional regulator [Planctomycetota bacterium]